MGLVDQVRGADEVAHVGENDVLVVLVARVVDGLVLLVDLRDVVLGNAVGQESRQDDGCAGDLLVELRQESVHALAGSRHLVALSRVVGSSAAVSVSKSRLISS